MYSKTSKFVLMLLLGSAFMMSNTASAFQHSGNDYKLLQKALKSLSQLNAMESAQVEDGIALADPEEGEDLEAVGAPAESGAPAEGGAQADHNNPGDDGKSGEKGQGAEKSEGAEAEAEIAEELEVVAEITNSHEAAIEDLGRLEGPLKDLNEKQQEVLKGIVADIKPNEV